MKKRKSKKNDRLVRNSVLIADRTKKMALTYIGSTLCAQAVILVDSLVAGISIGPEALAAIAAAGPLLAIEQILHCILGFGIDKLMIQEIGKGNRKEADRIFGAILITVALVYMSVYIPLLIFERPLIQFIMGDQPLVDLVIRYTQPLFITAPIFEVFLCIERAFRVDGRVQFFTLRSIITNIANILLDILMVSVLNLNLTGLAWSSVISTTLGFLITLSHFFSSQRTVSPDFSVLKSKKEMLDYVKRDIHLGECATLDEVMDALALSLQTSAIGVLGGPGGLAIWAVFKSLRGIVLSLGNGVSASVAIHAGWLNGMEDYDGARFSVEIGVGIAVTASLGIMFIVHFFAGGIAELYHIAPELRPLCAQCLQIGSLVFTSFGFLTVLGAYLPAVNRMGLTNLQIILQKGLTIIAAGIGYSVGMVNFYGLYVIALWIAALFMLFLLLRDRHWFLPKRNPEMIKAYSIPLEPAKISELSVDAAKNLRAFEFPEDFCRDISEIIELGLNFIAKTNPASNIRGDIQMRRHERHLQIILIDDGEAYNPLTEITKDSHKEPETSSTVDIMGLKANVNYDRVLGLNSGILDVIPPEKAAG